MKYFIANWKANKNLIEVIDFLNNFSKNYQAKKEVSVIICPAFPFLREVKEKTKSLLNVAVGSQTAASYEKGSYTGEVTANMLQDLVGYAIVGHSERRKNFQETDEELQKKVLLLKNNHIEPIYCIRDEKDQVPEGVKFIAYEPVAAIGTGQNESPEKVVLMKNKLRLPKNSIFIYGGSVNEKNVSDYLKTGAIDGFLIGGASLDAAKFLQIINHT